MFHNTAGFGKSSNAQEREGNIKRTSQLMNEYNNPCMKEQELSYKCLNENGYDGDKCKLHFANYKACKEFWSRVRSDRRAKGIEPFLPWPEERAQIRAEFMSRKQDS